MIVDLNPLPCTIAVGLIRMCVEYNIDNLKCLEIVEAMSVVNPSPDIKWELDIPEKYITFFLLKHEF
jgi:hypothetical protein